MEEVWRRAFRDLLGDGPKYGGDIKECPVLLAEPPLTQKAVREKTTEIMFEQFGVPALYLSMQAVLALYASGRTTGIVLDSGDGVTHAVPISDCYAITPAIIQLDFAGDNLTKFLVDSLSKRSPYITSENGRDIKEKRCRFALNLEEFSSPSEESYDLPDGKRVSIGNERFCTPEALFQYRFVTERDPNDPKRATLLKPDPEQPTLIFDPNQLTSSTPSKQSTLFPPIDESKIVGIHGVIHKSISNLKLDSELIREMYGNVVLAGGTTMFPNLDKRLRAELASLVDGVEVNVSPSKKHSTWLGGSVLASLSTFDSLWCTKEEYEEQGRYYKKTGGEDMYKTAGFHPGDIIHKMCPLEKPGQT
ncbi:hypothetical protein AX14_012423 [Amanita brunnescens Koide BX004]|nr:hypothetical protein AX14_012423 [Amanita brunnescens Koide BX004]